ncbi:hypothetical protein DUI87_20424 [Hirundo rustica rustica]|uniref:SAM domain-containing protein n=1 Tax=Hirundo rustica rustica TaxID=333673 RepID=A0A3M0JWQ9_HIRRU|nr:hypothetical protein DUI87_20424 [Hirundo rustica rustica]
MLPVPLWPKEEEKGPTYRKFMGFYMVLPKSQLTISVVRIDVNIPTNSLMKQIGHDGYNPSSVAEWLDSIELGDYTKSFLINGYTSMDLVKKIWEIELINIDDCSFAVTSEINCNVSSYKLLRQPLHGEKPDIICY